MSFLRAALWSALWGFLLACLLFVMIMAIAPRAIAQTEADWARAGVQIGPAKAHAAFEDPIITFTGGVQFHLWGVDPRPSFRRELGNILEEKVTCRLREGAYGLKEFLAVYCRTDSIPDVAAELVRRGAAYPDTLSGKQRKK